MSAEKWALGCALVAIGCTSAAPRIARVPVVVPPPPAPLPAEPYPPPPQIGAGRDFTCLLHRDRLQCVGAVPSATGDEQTTVVHPMEADLLFVGDTTYCAARAGDSSIRCFGGIYAQPPAELLETWDSECANDAACIEAREGAWSAEGIRLDAGGPIRDFAGAENHLYALRDDGRVRCWDLDADDLEQPLEEFEVADAQSIDAALGVLCALMETGEVQCRAGFPPRAGPMAPIARLPAVVRIAVTSSFSCAWDVHDEAYCWGFYLPIEGVELPEDAAARVARLHGVRAIASGDSDAEVVCALERLGTIACWGDNRYGGLGRSVRSSDAPTQAIRPDIPPAVGIAVGAAHACALDVASELRCWGRGNRGALGEAHRRTDFAPLEVPAVRADAIAVSGNRSCARTSSGWTCWGSRDLVNPLREPWAARSMDTPREAVPVVFRYRSCTHRAGTLRCAREDEPDLVYEADALAPSEGCFTSPRGRVSCVRDGDAAQVPHASRATLLAADNLHLAVLNTHGELQTYARSGDAMVRDRFIRAFDDATHLTLARGIPCVRRRDSTVWCARSLADRQLVRVELPPIEELVHGWGHVCARAANGAVHCSGSDDGVRAAPEGWHVIGGVNGAVEIGAGHRHTCARVRDGRVICWGDDSEGQLGSRPAWWQDGPVVVAR